VDHNETEAAHQTEGRGQFPVLIKRSSMLSAAYGYQITNANFPANDISPFTEMSPWGIYGSTTWKQHYNTHSATVTMFWKEIQYTF
jgi:hypothetical protein